MSSARAAITRLGQIGAPRSVETTRGRAIRCFSDDKGRVLSEEERAKESIIQRTASLEFITRPSIQVIRQAILKK
ncbi:unnamed protein product [Eruca vesicaria subsp. sativa]|uniref:Uncharacterized protein n=1 Tax=Eruca vesicaria subsp. sativa TaxID=29727 RepID=A0ABC8L9Y2_ERUVS|nr:unnamed protein product [Eruca vesicaria subsp. sativa]